MNSILQTKVKDKCKDMGLSEEYVMSITEKIGGSVAEDSTDETAIELVANQIMEIAKLSQGEATRWVNKHKEKNEPAKQEPKKQEPKETEPAKQKQVEKEDEPDWFKSFREAQEKRIKQLEEQNATLAAERTKAERTASINAAFVKHSIPESLREFVAVPETIEQAAIDGYVAGLAQKIVTLQLPNRDGKVQVEGTEITKEQANDIASKLLPGFGKKE